MRVAQPAIPSLRWNFAWTLSGNVVYAGCQWGMLVVLAKLGSPEMVGQFALGLAVTAPVFMLGSLALRPAQATDARGEYEFGDYLALRIVTSVFALILVGAITVAVGYRRETALVILGVGLAKAVESLSDVVHGLFQQRYQMHRIAKSMMARGVISLVLLTSAVRLSGSLLWGVLGLLLAWTFVLLAYDIRCAPSVLGTVQSRRPRFFSKRTYVGSVLRPQWHAATLKRLAWLTLPLGLATMLGSLNANIPRYFVEHYLGEGDLGIFAAMAYLAISGGMVVNALGQSASPRLAKCYSENNDSAFLTLLLRLVGIGLLLSAAGVVISALFGRELLTWLYRPEYARHADVLVWLLAVAAAGYVSSFLGYGMTAARLFRPQPALSATSAATAAACSYLFIPEYGLKGAAWAYGVSLCVQLSGALLCNVYALRRTRVRPAPPAVREALCPE